MKRHADNAQIESEDVAAVRVFRTGESDMSARKTRMDVFSALAPRESFRVREHAHEETAPRHTIGSPDCLVPTMALQQLPNGIPCQEGSAGYPNKGPRIKEPLSESHEDGKEDEDAREVLAYRARQDHKMAIGIRLKVCCTFVCVRSPFPDTQSIELTIPAE